MGVTRKYSGQVEQSVCLRMVHIAVGYLNLFRDIWSTNASLAIRKGMLPTLGKLYHCALDRLQCTDGKTEAGPTATAWASVCSDDNDTSKVMY